MWIKLTYTHLTTLEQPGNNNTLLKMPSSVIFNIENAVFISGVFLAIQVAAFISGSGMHIARWFTF